MKSSAHKGAALLIAVLCMLLFSVMSVHLITLAQVDYRTSLMRRYTSNTALHSETGILRIVANMDQGLQNYGPELVGPMKPMMAYLGQEEREIVARAYGYKWLVRQYFEWGISAVDLSVGGRRRLTYEVETEMPREGMVTTVRASVYAKGMTGKANDSGWIDTVPSKELEDLTDYDEVLKQLTALERSIAGGDELTRRTALASLQQEMNKPALLVESIAQTEEDGKIYDTQQRLGRVSVAAIEGLAGLELISAYSWGDQIPEALRYGVQYRGGLEDLVGQLVVQGSMRVLPVEERLEEQVKRLGSTYWEAMATLAQGSVVYHTTGGRVDLDALAEASVSEAMLVVVDSEVATTLYQSNSAEGWPGIVLAYTPLLLEGEMVIQGVVLCDGPLQILEGGVRVIPDGELFWKIGHVGIQEKLVKDGLWKGANLDGRAMGQRAICVGKRPILGTRLETMKDGRMVDSR